MPEDVGAAERMVREWQERATERAEKFDRMREQVDQISVTESSRDGAVRLTIGANGLLQDLQLSENAGNRPMAKLSAEIMRTLRVAQSRLPDLMQQAAADTVGAEDTAGQYVVGQIRQTFPAVSDEDEEEPAQRGGVREMEFDVEDDRDVPSNRSRRSRPEPDEPDDFGSGSFLR